MMDYDKNDLLPANGIKEEAVESQNADGAEDSQNEINIGDLAEVVVDPDDLGILGNIVKVASQIMVDGNHLDSGTLHFLLGRSSSSNRYLVTVQPVTLDKTSGTFTVNEDVGQPSLDKENIRIKTELNDDVDCNKNDDEELCDDVVYEEDIDDEHMEISEIHRVNYDTSDAIDDNCDVPAEEEEEEEVYDVSDNNRGDTGEKEMAENQHIDSDYEDLKINNSAQSIEHCNGTLSRNESLSNIDVSFSDALSDDLESLTSDDDSSKADTDSDSDISLMITDDSKGNLTCTECGFVSKTNFEIRSHIKSEHLVKVFQCRHCSYITSKKDHLFRHLSNVHTDKEELLTVEDVRAPTTEDIQNVNNIKNENIQNVNNIKSEDIQNVNNIKTEEIQNVNNIETEDIQNINTITIVDSDLSDMECDDEDIPDNFNIKPYIKNKDGQTPIKPKVKKLKVEKPKKPPKKQPDNPVKNKVNGGITASETILKCYKCEFTCQDHTQYYRHIGDHHDDVDDDEEVDYEDDDVVDIIYDETIVTEKTDEEILSALGFKSGEDGSRLYCNLCSYSSLNRKGLKQHIQCTHRSGTAFKCVYCSYTTYHRANFTRHVSIVHMGEKNVYCKECDFVTSRDYLLQKHVMFRHKGIKPYQCKECDYKTTSCSNFKAHVTEIHRGLRPYKCPEKDCTFATSRRFVLKKHIRGTHMKNTKGYNEVSFCCPHCDHKSTQSSNLKRHIKVRHRGEKELYQCSLCDYIATQKTYVETHIAEKHKGIYQFSCQLCDFKTSTKQRYDRHYNSVHLGEKPFSCELCDFRCSQKGHLSHHIDVLHKGEKPHLCVYCSFHTGHRGNLKAHLKTVHKIDQSHVKYILEKCADLRKQPVFVVSTEGDYEIPMVISSSQDITTV